MTYCYGRSVLDWPIGVTVYNPAKCYGGYTIVNPYRSSLIFLIDMRGRIVHTWHADPERIGESWFMRRLENGNWLNLVYYVPNSLSHTQRLTPTLWSAPGLQAGLVEQDWEGNVVWRYLAPDGWDINHDMTRLENGNTLIRMERLIHAPAVSDKQIADDIFVEIDSSGERLWQWSTVEHIDQFGYSETGRRTMYEQGGALFLTNTCTVLPPNELEDRDPRFRRGNILSSQRNTNRIYIVDRQSGDVVWKWGNGPGQLVGQHHPVMLHNGHILVYDNGGQGGYPARCRFYTRLIEMDPLSDEIVWQYAHEPLTLKPMSRFFSSSWGSVQRLPNGNTFSLDCHKGRLFEVTPWGEIVWEYISPFAWGRGTRVVEPGIYRAYRYGYDSVLEVDPWFPNTDGQVGIEPVQMPLPEGLGLPSSDRP
jgi:hypothetical protein